jgi:hypothetical protein
MEHLFNCHGEWLMLVSALSSLPLVGTWLRARLAKPHGTE